MHHHPASPKQRPIARSRRAVGALGAGLLVPMLLLSGCASSNPGEAAAAAAAKPLSQAAFISRQLTLSSSDFGAYLRQQSARLVPGTADFVTAWESGDSSLARALYAPTRSFYARMLAAAGSFPELDTALDSPGSGWHAAEADLFPAPAGDGGSVSAPLTGEQRTAIGQQLDADTEALSQAVSNLRPTVREQAAGVAALMPGRAAEALAGRQEPASHTDLSDLQGYLDGSREVFSGLRPILVTENAALATTLDHRFDAAQGELNALRTGVTFPGFDTLSDGQRQSLQGAFADLTESLGQVPSTLAD